MSGRDVDHGLRQGELIFDDAEIAKVRGGFDAARLTQARLLKGRSKADVARELNVSPAAVGQWEAGIQPPRPYLIAELAAYLDVPPAFFALGRPYARMDAGTAHFRSLRRTRASHRDKAVAFVEQLWELTYALEKRVELPAVDLPNMDAGGLRWSAKDVPDDPESAARYIRTSWNVPAGPFRHLVNTLENHGIIVSHVPFAGTDTATIDAFSTSHLVRPLVVTTPDRANDVYRHRFTVAHELGHLLLHHNVAPGDIQQEREADSFAAALLTPIDEVAKDMPSRLHLSALDPVSRKWGVSIKSLIRRSRELGSVSDVSARRAYQRYEQLRAAGAIHPEPISLYRGESPTLLRRAFETAEKYGSLTLPQLAEELVWDVKRVRLLLGIDDQRPRLTLVKF